jgi:hypothetical protein
VFALILFLSDVAAARQKFSKIEDAASVYSAMLNLKIGDVILSR